MRKEGAIFTFLFLTILLMANISAAGICTLDKETYHPGEDALFSCLCTHPSEEGVDGNIVWRKADNTVLQNTSINSNSCRTSVFGGSFLFPVGADYLGNATFDTGDAAWSGDIVSDNFNVTGAGIRDCIISNITTLPTFQIGGVGAVKIDVIDGITRGGLVHASCIAEGLDINEVPLMFEPRGEGDNSFRISTAEGHVDFTHEMTEPFWEIDTTYILEFHCFSLPNDTWADTQHIAYDSSTGEPAGFKECTTEVLFTTSTTDLRALSNFQITVYIFISLLLILISYFFYKVSNKTDFDSWLKKIQATSGKNNIIKVVFASVAFSFMKEYYLIMYMLLLPVVLMFEDLISLAGIDSISTITSIFSNIYSVGMLVVVVLFFGKLQRFIRDMVNYTKNEAWGIDNG